MVKEFVAGLHAGGAGTMKYLVLFVNTLGRLRCAGLQATAARCSAGGREGGRGRRAARAPRPACVLECVSVCVRACGEYRIRARRVGVEPPRAQRADGYVCSRTASGTMSSKRCSRCEACPGPR